MFLPGGDAVIFTQTLSADLIPIYTVNLAFAISGADLMVAGSLAGINSVAINSTLTGKAGALLGSIGTNWDVNPANTEADTNDMWANNLLVTVPEPSTFTLAGLTVLGLISRRRRN